MAVLRKLWSRAVRLSKLENGQGLFEYTLLVALVAAVAIASVTTLGETLVNKLYTLGTSF